MLSPVGFSLTKKRSEQKQCFCGDRGLFFLSALDETLRRNKGFPHLDASSVRAISAVDFDQIHEKTGYF